MTANPVDFTSPFLLLGIGATIGIGIMIIGLAKWGKNIFGSTSKWEKLMEDSEENSNHTFPCRYAKDHPVLHKFMSDSETDRQRMWTFLGTISSTQQEMKGKLDLLLQGARVRWNSNLIPPEGDKR